MDRAAWRRERRRVTQERFDTLHAAAYDQQEWAAISPTHRRFVAELVGRCPPGGRILDAACGTGKYFAMVLEAGRRLVGTDQSAGMLARAHAKHPEVPLHQVGLQELAYTAEFDAVICVDAMEYVFPEDWPGVLANLRRALRPGGHLYLTVELIDEQELERVFTEAAAQGLPVIRGEYTAPGGGYHYSRRRRRCSPGSPRPACGWSRTATATTTTTCCCRRPASHRTWPAAAKPAAAPRRPGACPSSSGRRPRRPRSPAGPR